MTTLHFKDSEMEIHKIVVGPLDNNVFIVRCRQTGEGLLIDAANEHERLLELCESLNVQKVLETHGHWDHVQAVPQVRAYQTVGRLGPYMGRSFIRRSG